MQHRRLKANAELQAEIRKALDGGMSYKKASSEFGITHLTLCAVFGPSPNSKRPHIGEARRNRVIELAKAGGGRNEIAEQTGMDASTVSHILIGAGLSFNHAWSDEDLDFVARMYDDGEPVSEIAEALGLRIGQVQPQISALRRKGIIKTRRSNGKGGHAKRGNGILNVGHKAPERPPVERKSSPTPWPSWGKVARPAPSGVDVDAIMEALVNSSELRAALRVAVQEGLEKAA